MDWDAWMDRLVILATATQAPHSCECWYCLPVTESTESPAQFLCLTSNFLYILRSLRSRVLRINTFLGQRKVAFNNLSNLNCFYLLSINWPEKTGSLDSFAKPWATFKEKQPSLSVAYVRLTCCELCITAAWQTWAAGCRAPRVALDWHIFKYLSLSFHSLSSSCCISY